MNLRSFRSHSLKGFTLIELLVVITIIAILASIAVPTSNIVMRKARELQAKSAIKGLEVAIKGYQTEYNRFPIIGSGTDSEPIETTSPDLLQVLMAKEGGGTGKLNSREIRFYEPPTGKGKTGFDSTTGVLLDAFGKGLGYRVHMDYDGDGQIPNPYDSSTDLTSSVIVYSAGSNGRWDLTSATKSKEFDDIKSWD